MPTYKREGGVRQTVTKGVLVVLAVVLTTSLRLTLNPLLGRRAALILYFPALVFSAWLGGWGGGLGALGLSALAAIYFFISPHHSLSVANQTDQITLLVFTSVGLSVSALSNSQRKAWQQAKKSAAVLRESEARKSAVLDVALDCIITADHQGRILEFNPAAERTFGYARAEVLGRTIAEVIIPPSLRTAYTQGLAHYNATGESPILGKRIEVVGMHRDGSEFPVEVAVVPTSGGTVEFAAYLRDITQRRRQEEERTALLQEVQTSVRRQRALLQDVLASVTEGHLVLCDTAEDLPTLLTPLGPSVVLTPAGGLRELRHRTQEACRSADFPEERCYDLITAASEAGMNAAVHVGEGQGHVFFDADRGSVQVRITDSGPGIAVENLPHATLMKGYSSAGTLGHGMKMMLQTVDRVFLLTGPTGTTVVVEQGRIAPPVLW